LPKCNLMMLISLNGWISYVIESRIFVKIQQWSFNRVERGVLEIIQIYNSLDFVRVSVLCVYIMVSCQTNTYYIQHTYMI
jgi:hypothetical protein